MKLGHGLAAVRCRSSCGNGNVAGGRRLRIMGHRRWFGDGRKDTKKMLMRLGPSVAAVWPR